MYACEYYQSSVPNILSTMGSESVSAVISKIDKETGNNLLHRAFMSDVLSPAAIECLLANGIDDSLKNKEGKTPWKIAEEKKVSLRTAAYLLGIGRVGRATVLGGI